MTSPSSQGSAGNIPGQFGMEAGGGNTVFLSPDPFLAVAVLLGGFYGTPEGENHHCTDDIQHPAGLPL